MVIACQPQASQIIPTNKWISLACGGVGTPVTLRCPTGLHRIIKIDKHYMFETMEQKIYVQLQGFTRQYITSYVGFLSTHYLIEMIIWWSLCDKL